MLVKGSGTTSQGTIDVDGLSAVHRPRTGLEFLGTVPLKGLVVGAVVVVSHFMTQCSWHTDNEGDSFFEHRHCSSCSGDYRGERRPRKDPEEAQCSSTDQVGGDSSADRGQLCKYHHIVAASAANSQSQSRQVVPPMR